MPSACACTHQRCRARAVWLRVVNDQPATTFSATTRRCRLYCRHVVNARVIADELLAFDRAWLADGDRLKRYDRLLAMSEREGQGRIVAGNARLRITRQAVDHPETVARSCATSRRSNVSPWNCPQS